jgi:peptidoglycan/LPS O-acetylase OafA/YrhL
MKNWKLELIRGFAAILVFIGHLVSINTNLKSHSFLTFISSWGTESVIIFFILSGIVINLSFSKNPTNRINFFKNRLIRIYPQYIIGIGFAILVSSIGISKEISINELIGNLFFLGTFQNYLVSVLDGNPVIWSLTFEIFFYSVFMFISGRNQKLAILIWLMVALFLVPLYYLSWNKVFAHFISMFAFSSIWLVGYLLAEFRYIFIKPRLFTALFFLGLLPGISRLHISDNYYCVIKYLLFAVISIPFFLYVIKDEKKINHEESSIFDNKNLLIAVLILFIFSVLNFSNSLDSSKLFYLFFPSAICLFMFLKKRTIIILAISKYLNLPDKIVETIALYAGKYSYSLYIVHFPILLFINHYIPNPILYFFLGSSISVCTSILLEEYFQKIFLKLK